MAFRDFLGKLFNFVLLCQVQCDVPSLLQRLSIDNFWGNAVNHRTVTSSVLLKAGRKTYPRDEITHEIFQKPFVENTAPFSLPACSLISPKGHLIGIHEEDREKPRMSKQRSTTRNINNHINMNIKTLFNNKQLKHKMN